MYERLPVVFVTDTMLDPFNSVFKPLVDIVNKQLNGCQEIIKLTLRPLIESSSSLRVASGICCNSILNEGGKIDSGSITSNINFLIDC